MAKEFLFKETRGRKKAADPIMPVTIYIHNSIISGGDVLEADSAEYKEKLDKMKRKLTENVYSTMIEKSNPYSMK